MKIKKMVSAMTSGILAAIISVSAVPLTANAEPEKGKLTVSLLDFNISDEPVYPSTVRGDELYDFELILKRVLSTKVRSRAVRLSLIISYLTLRVLR